MEGARGVKKAGKTYGRKKEWKLCIVTELHVNDCVPQAAGFCTET